MEHKSFDGEVKGFNDEKLRVTHFISTEHKDRHGDIVRADGMKVKGRPVVLWGHGRDHLGKEPIAKPIWIKPGMYKGQKGIEAETQFFPDEVGKRLYRKVRDRFLHSWSIGFLSIKEEPLKGQNGPFAGRDIKEFELLEYSLVAVPSNAYATVPREAEQLSFKVLYDSESPCQGKCGGSVRCAGHRDKYDPKVVLFIRQAFEKAIGEKIQREIYGKVR